MSLQTGKRIHRHGWTVLPASKEVIDRVNYLGKKQKQPLVKGNLTYDWVPTDNYNDSNLQLEGELTTSENNQEVNDDVSVDNEVSENITVRDLPEWEPFFVGENEHHNDESIRLEADNNGYTEVHDTDDFGTSTRVHPLYDDTNNKKISKNRNARNSEENVMRVYGEDVNTVRTSSNVHDEVNESDTEEALNTDAESDTDSSVDVK